jgi:hypothetical protein
VPFTADSFRVLIASPSDLVEERSVATQAINEWNAQNAAAEGIVLLPVTWETHAMPETGVRPQDAINRQLVDDGDVLVGLFWTRLGSDTGVAESGTLEEIDRFVDAGKPAMLYFSRRPIDPSRIDLEQHRRLRDFRNATQQRALVGSFRDLDELQSTLLRDLTRQVRRLRTTAALLHGPRLRLGVTERDVDGELHDAATITATPHPTAGNAIELRIITENFGDKSAHNLKWIVRGEPPLAHWDLSIAAWTDAKREYDPDGIARFEFGLETLHPNGRQVSRLRADAPALNPFDLLVRVEMDDAPPLTTRLHIVLVPGPAPEL